MSTTYSAVCDDCKERCWVGQGHNLHSYGYVTDFFLRHINHRLSFINDLVEDEARKGYVEYPDDV